MSLFWGSLFFSIDLSILSPIPHFLIIIVALLYVLKSHSVNTQTIFIFNIVFVILGILSLHRRFRFIFVDTKKLARILICIVLIIG